MALQACGDDVCSPEDDHCQGNVAWVCNGGGDKGPLHWESQDCGREDLVCRNGVCFATPLVPCSLEEAGQWTCDPTGRVPGRCSEAGFWGWDVSRPCDPDRDETCATGQVVQDGQTITLAMCVLATPTACSAESSGPACDGDRVTDCTPIGRLAIVRDCAADGMVCGQGTCVTPP